MLLSRSINFHPVGRRLMMAAASPTINITPCRNASSLLPAVTSAIAHDRLQPHKVPRNQGLVTTRSFSGTGTTMSQQQSTPPHAAPSSVASARQAQSQSALRAPMSGPTTAREKLDYAKAQASRIGRYVLVGAGAYAIYWVATEVTGFFVGFSLLDVGEIGFFIGGACSTALLGAALIGTRRLGVRSAPRAMSAIVKRLEHDPTLRTRLGAFQVGDYQSSAKVGGFHLKPLPLVSSGSSGSLLGKLVFPQWSGPQRLHLVFQLKGVTDSAVVSADVTRRLRGPYTYRSLVVDVDSTGERLVYEGTERDVLFKSLLRLRSS